MTRRWRNRSSVREIIVSPEEAARRKADAVHANAKIADIQIPQLREQLAAHEKLLQELTTSRDLPPSEASALRNQLMARELSARRAKEEIRSLQQLISIAEIQINKIIGADKQKQGAIRCAFFGYTPSPEASSQIAQQRTIIQRAQFIIRSSLYVARELPHHDALFAAAFDAAVATRKSLRYYELAKQKYSLAQQTENIAREAEKERKQRQGLKDAIVAAFFERTRSLADEIRKQLVEQPAKCPFCPYCGGEYGDEPHADHIHHVSRGGLSTLANMVLVCSACNLKKSDKTLREFILQYQLDRHFVEMNLEQLLKEF